MGINRIIYEIEKFLAETTIKYSEYSSAYGMKSNKNRVEKKGAKPPLGSQEVFIMPATNKKRKKKKKRNIKTRDRLPESLESLGPIDKAIRGINDVIEMGDIDVHRVIWLLDLLSTVIRSGVKLSPAQGNRLATAILKIYAYSHSEVLDADKGITRLRSLGAPATALEKMEKNWNEKYLDHQNFHYSFEGLVGQQRDEDDQPDMWWSFDKSGISDIYQKIVNANLIDES